MFVVAAAVSIIWPLVAAPILSSKEAARVALAQQPIGDLLDDTRRLGLRPLWYLYEHAWIALFGAGDHSVHLSTAVIAIAVLPAAYAAGRAIGIDDFGALAVLAFVASPLLFAAGTGVGPDALLILLATLGLWAFARAVRSGSPAAIVLVALAIAALMWTHQWSLFAACGAGVAGIVLATQDGGAQRRRGWWVVGAVVAGAVSILLWTTSLLSVPSADGAVVQRLRPATVITAALAAFHGGTQPVISAQNAASRFGSALSRGSAAMGPVPPR
jgi:4-amino-4-deoxy-L-arabinose transferase-like glycosyltransferase